MKTKIINICGGPSVGKSVIATGLYSILRQRNVSCEIINEYAKEVTWEETHKLLENQIHIFAEQFRRQWRLLGKVDFIITDSPLILNSVYYDYYLSKTENPIFSEEYIQLSRNFFDSTFNEFNNINFFIERYSKDGKYSYFEKQGRNQTLEECLDIDKTIKLKLQQNNAEYFVMTGLCEDIIRNTISYLRYNGHL